jgi:hypothetical protein
MAERVAGRRVSKRKYDEGGTLADARSPSKGVEPKQGNLAQRIARLEDRAALKALVDTFFILADEKEVQKQVLLFTEDATVESRTGGTPGTPLKGRKQIGDAFSAFLANFQTVYHMNGQQAVTLDGDRATFTWTDRAEVAAPPR